LSAELIAGLSFLVAILLLSFGIHIGLVLGFVGVMGVWLILGDFNSVIGLLKSTPYAAVGIYDLSVVPLFILMGEFAYSGGISSEAFDALNRLIGKVRGGLAIATTWGCVAFGATSGSSVATASVFTKAAYPEMMKAGYDKYFATGVIAVASTLDMLIPPSLYMVIFGILARTSIAQLLMAGLIPGLLMALALTLSIYIQAVRRPALAPALNVDYSWRERSLYTLKAWPLALLALIIIGGIYSGVMTPTESAAVGAFAALLINLGFRRLTWATFRGALAEAAYTSAMLSFVVIGATIFSRLMTLSGLPIWLGNTISNSGLSSVWIIAIILVIYGVLGCFIDALSIMFITTPIFAPILMGLGVNLIWFGVLNCVILNIGMITPPFGLAVFTVKAAAGADVKVEGVFKGTFFLYPAIILTLILLIIFPQISTIATVVIGG
jgi:C4-dicarboxylate transporter, DctM subunit